jgi:hypothetical protein
VQLTEHHISTAEGKIFRVIETEDVPQQTIAKRFWDCEIYPEYYRRDRNGRWSIEVRQAGSGKYLGTITSSELKLGEPYEL